MVNEMNVSGFEAEDAKRAWVSPKVQRLEAGAAESFEGGNPDSSSPQKS